MFFLHNHANIPKVLKLVKLRKKKDRLAFPQPK